MKKELIFSSLLAVMIAVIGLSKFAFKKDIKENLSKAGKENAAHKTEENVINAVCDATEIDIPDAMINSQIDKMLRDFDMNMRYQGLNLEQYLKYTGMTVDKMRAQFKDDAAKNVKTSLVLE